MEDRSSLVGPAKEIEKEMASPDSQLKYGCKSDNSQSRSCGTSKLLSHDSSGGAKKSSYGSFLATEETTSVVSSSGSLLRKREAEQIPSGLAFVNVSYQVPPTFGWLPGNKSMAKTILRPASGLMLPGLNAIMGPTGSGKTTLLDVLADRKASSHISGSIFIDGVERRKDFRFLSGYVVQDDVVTGSLTVRENLHFSAALRLPSQMTHAQRKERVDRVIEELGLKNCSEQQIGTEFIRGVSGGERKRTNIGMELIIEPQVLFLDEPTTGLDANTAVSVVQLLKRMDVDFHAGFECEEHNNPADFFLDVIMQCEDVNESDDRSVPNLSSKYLESSEYRAMSAMLEPIVDRVDVCNSNYSMNCATDSYATNILWQSLVVAWRSGLKMWRNPMTNILQFFVNAIFALLVGGIFFMRDDTPRGMADRLGAFFFLVMSQVFGNLGAIELFIKERSAFLHESSSGYYRVSVFFIATVVTDLVILRALPVGVFCTITYFMLGLQRSVEKFFIFVLTLALTTTAGAALAFTFSAMVSVFAVANLLVALVFILYMLFGGFIIGLTSLPSWIQWMKYLSIFRYAIEALAVNELKDQVYNETIGVNDTCPYQTRVIGEEKYCFADGNEVLIYTGYHIDWIWWDQIALAITALMWLALSYMVLRVVKAYYRQYK